MINFCSSGTYKHFVFSDTNSGILIAGGQNKRGGITNVEILTNSSRQQLPDLPIPIFLEPSMFQHGGSIMMCGGLNNEKCCIQLENNTWSLHSYLNSEREAASSVATDRATFLFGGTEGSQTYEYLPINSSKWQPGVRKIPNGFSDGSAIPVSENEIWLIGGEPVDDSNQGRSFGSSIGMAKGGTFSNISSFIAFICDNLKVLGQHVPSCRPCHYSFDSNNRRILSFDIRSHTFTELPLTLNQGRSGHRCSYIPGSNSILVTGGTDGDGSMISSTEIIDLATHSIFRSANMKRERCSHSIGILTIDNQEKVAVVGGWSNQWLYGIETYDPVKNLWDVSSIKLDEPRYDGGFLTVKC